jgi:hypothetical protein
MTIRTFWTILIKILGIWLVLDSLNVIPTFFMTVYETALSGSEQGTSMIMVLLLLTLGIYIAVLRLFLFKSAWLIDKLRLDKDFDQDNMNLEIKESSLFSIAVIVTGGILFADGLPELCRQVFSYFQQERVFGENPGSGRIIFYLIKTLIGYLLMTNSKLVIKFIEKQRTKPTDNN